MVFGVFYINLYVRWFTKIPPNIILEINYVYIAY